VTDLRAQGDGNELANRGSNWKQFKGKVKAQWGKLTDDHLDVISGRRDELAGRIQEAYGISKDEAEKQIKAFEDRNKD
jgi:uncharacterized protein YjbJ (UPF0337 family)